MVSGTRLVEQPSRSPSPKVMIDEPRPVCPAGDLMILDALDRLPVHVAVLLIEHDMPLVFHFAREITVLAEGHGDRGARQSRGLSNAPPQDALMTKDRTPPRA